MKARMLQEAKPQHALGVIVGAAALMVLTAIFAGWAFWRQDRLMREDLLHQTRLLVQTLNPNNLKKLDGNISDENKPEYRRLKAQLMAAQQIDPDWQWIYLMGRTTNRTVFFQMDSEAYDAPDPSPPGQTYEEATDTLHGVFDAGRSTVEGPVPDRWGVWVSAFVPVKDPRTGRLLSVAGIDIEASRWNRMRMCAMWIPLASGLALLALWLGGNYLLALRARLETGRTRMFRYLESFLAAATGLVLTATIAWLIHQIEVRNQQIAFRRLADIEANPIFSIAEDLRNLEMNGFASFFESSDEVTDEEFRQYAAHLSSISEVVFWGWADTVEAKDRPGFEAAAAARTDKPDYHIWELDATGSSQTAAARDRYYPIVHMAPREEYDFALGYDIGSATPQGTLALGFALQTRLPTAIEPIPILQSQYRGKVLCLVRRASRPGHPKRLNGLVVAGLNIQRWLNASLNMNPDRRPMATLDLLEMRHGLSPVWLGTTAQRAGKEPLLDLQPLPSGAIVRPLLTFGKTYAVVARPTAAFIRLQKSTVWLVALVGLILTGTSAWLLGFFANRRENLARLVNEQSRDLAASMHHYGLLAKQSRVITWELDIDGYYVDISDMAELILGYRPDEIIGKLHFYDLCPDEYREEFKREGLKLFHAGQPVTDMVNAMVAKSGKIVWVSSSAIPIRDAQGNLTGYWGTDTDITDRKLAEEAMERLAREKQEAADRYAALIKASNTGAWEYDDSTRRMWCSPEYFTMLGYDPREFDLPPERQTVQSFWLDLIHPGDREAAAGYLASYLANPGRPYDCRFRMQRKNGQWAWIWSRGQMLSDKNGNPTSRIVGTHIDITDSMHAEEAVRESEQKYRMLTESMKDVVWILDAETLRFLYVSPSVERLRGFTPAEVMAGTVEATLAPGQIGKLQEMLRVHAEEFRRGKIQSDSFFVIELLQPRKDGTIVTTEAVVRFWLNRQTGRLELHGVTRDITDRKLAEKALADAVERYDLLAKQNRIVTWAIDLQGLYTSLGPETPAVADYSAETLVGKTHFYELHPEEGREDFKAKVLGFVKRGEPFRNLVHPVVTGSGGIVWVSSNGIPMRDSQGNIAGSWGTSTDITDLRRAEQDYRTLFQNMIEGFALHEIVCDVRGRPVDYRFLAVNPAFERLTGLKAADIIGKTAREVLPNLEESWIETFGNVVQTGLPAFFDNHSTPLGRQFEVTAFRSGAGQFASIFNDITERNLIETELRESRRRYAALLASLPGMAYRCRNDQDWTMEFASQGSLELTGYAPADLVQNKVISFNKLIRAPYREQVWNDWQQAIREHRRYEGEYEISTRDGETKWAWEQGEAIYDEQDRVVALEGFISDITARKRAETEREQLIRAIEQSGETILITDPDGTILYVNPAFTRITGYTREEAIGQTPRLLSSGKHDKEFYREMWKTLEAGQTWEGQLINKRKDGTLYTEQASISPVRDIAGRIVNFVAVKRDISQQLRDQEEKEALESQLVHAQKLESVGRLAGGVAHDFNNMLQAILGYTEIAIEQVPVGQPLHADLLEIQKAAQRSTSLTRQLQTFARKQVSSPRVLNINEAVEGMSAMLRRLIGEGVQLVWKPGKDLGTVKIDPSQLDQIVANLCINARDAIGKEGHITLETGNAEIPDAGGRPHGDIAPGSYTLLTVRDDGCGMRPDVLEHIFEPFFTTKPIGKGTGLGLSTVYGIVKQNHGAILVDSAEGKGSTFRIYLPRYTGEEETPAGPAEKETLASSRHEVILLVEDEETILRTTRRILESLGYKVLATPSPKEAIQLFESHKGRIDLLLTDVIMPGMNGPELVRHLLEKHPRLKYLFMSGYTANLLAEQGVKENNADFIQKPFSRKMLAEKVKSAIGRR